ncbi:MAG: hypothetical protein ACI9XP_002038 [Lentimonas sp.]|jgi:uncharacterized protein
MEELLLKIENHVKKVFEIDATGHDWHHIDRVRKLALEIGKKEGADLQIVEIGALLHDISDHKFNGGKLNEGGNVAANILRDCGMVEANIERIKTLVDNISFKGAHHDQGSLDLETQVVQDADRMDALGAIGIARAFAYGGNKNRPIYQPDVKPKDHQSFEEYAYDKSHTINHFYEKLLLLKDKMNTNEGKRIAEQRHLFLETYLHQFYQEWEVKIT